MNSFYYQVRNTTFDSILATIIKINAPDGVNERFLNEQIQMEYRAYCCSYDKNKDIDRFRNDNAEYYIVQKVCEKLDATYGYVQLSGDIAVGNIDTMHDAIVGSL